MSEDHSTKRQRVSKACEQCRRKKVKCDGTLPICGNCVSLGMQCTYKESTKKRGPPKGYIEAIEGRLHRLEALLGSVIQEDDPRSQAILAELNAPLETAYGEVVRPRLNQQFMSFDSTFPSQPKVPTTTTFENHQSASMSLPENDSVNDNLGNLSIDESGQLRYYGKSSGFYMLRGSKNFQNGAFHFDSRGYRSRAGAQNPTNTLDVDPFEQPPEDLSQHLLDLYFTHFYPLLPLLHKKSFMAAMRSTSDRPSPLLLNAIYAVASRISSDIRVRTDASFPDTAGDLFFERARILLDFEWDDFRISTVQSLLLMSSHQNGALKSIRGWLYGGLAFRMAQNLGLNRNCDTWNLSDTEKEERKRVFYCCFVVDRLACAMHGRSPMIDERDYDAPYPSENDEDDVNRTPRIMDNFHQLIKLCELLGFVLRDLYTVKSRQLLSQMASPDNCIAALDKGLNAWMRKLPADLQYRPPDSRMGEKAPAPSLALCQTHMLFYTTLILLHRPFIPGPTQAAAPLAFPSASICTYAANRILDIVESLMAEGRLKNVNNYALFFMFTAGIIFINDASSADSMFAFEAKISINKIIRAMDEVEKTWITSARHCNILGELAGLREINLENVNESSMMRRDYSRQGAVPQPSIAVPNSPDSQSNDDPTQVSSFPTPAPICASIGLGYAPESLETAGQSTEGQTFDALGSAFWDMPTSFDIDEWNAYFSHQNYRPQTLPQDPPVSLPPTSQPAYDMASQPLPPTFPNYL